MDCHPFVLLSAEARERNTLYRAALYLQSTHNINAAFLKGEGMYKGGNINRYIKQSMHNPMPLQLQNSAPTVRKSMNAPKKFQCKTKCF